MIWIVAGLAVVAAAVAVLYNRLVRDRNRVDGAWSDIDVQLQRRHDLIPQLVKAVDQYAKYERATIEAVTALRAEAMRLTDVDALGRKEEELSGGVRRLLALAEQYPDLKANANFLDLQRELVETEDYLQFARRYYNGSVRALNTRVESVPGNIVAGWFGFSIRPYFQKESDEVAAVPLVNLGRLE
ncbi:MAG TPA: LemA family protein [Woeseiaceae bacterium]|nr:LemA family protein [Woeseiaceae bacterium]